MLPVVAEVVDVPKARHTGSQQAVQGQPVLVGHVIGVAPVAILSTVDVKQMQVTAAPAHGSQNRAMQVTQRRATRHQKAAPDRRLHAFQRYLEADHTRIGAHFRFDGLRHDPRTRTLGCRAQGARLWSFAGSFRRRQAQYARADEGATVPELCCHAGARPPRYRPTNFGGLFAWKASTPSAKSSDVRSRL